MKKLTATQKRVLQELIAECKSYRDQTVDEYLKKSYESSYEKTHEGVTYKDWEGMPVFTREDSPTNKEWRTKFYNDHYNGRLVTRGVNKRTIAKLQEAGYIESMEEWYNNDEKVQLNLKKCELE